MNPTERPYSVLIVSAADNFNRALSDLMGSARFSPVRRASSISAAQRILVQQSFDFVIVNAPLPDDAGVQFALDALEQDGTIVLLAVRAELHSQVYAKVSPYGVFTIAKPFSQQTMESALQWMVSARERVRKLEKKAVSIEDKISEIRLVNRAKWMLIDHRQMDEPAAHRYIEKQAMDRCVTRREIAEEIIRSYS